jgi:hypothetical protein
MTARKRKRWQYCRFESERRKLFRDATVVDLAKDDGGDNENGFDGPFFYISNTLDDIANEQATNVWFSIATRSAMGYQR